MKLTKSQFLLLLCTLIITHNLCASPIRTIIINPAGDAKNPGRQLNRNFARSETHRCAETLKKALEERYHSLKVVLTRAPGDTIAPLQNASFANKSHADLFLNIDFFKQTSDKPTVQTLHYVGDPLLDYAQQNPKSIDIIPLAHAHRQTIKQTNMMANVLKQQLTQTVDSNSFNVCEVQGLPVKSLLGITIPAIALDIGLSTDDQWKGLIQPLVDALGQLLYTKN